MVRRLLAACFGDDAGARSRQGKFLNNQIFCSEHRGRVLPGATPAPAGLPGGTH